MYIGSHLITLGLSFKASPVYHFLFWFQTEMPCLQRHTNKQLLQKYFYFNLSLIHI